MRELTMVSPPWWNRIIAPSCSVAFQKGMNSGWSKDRPLMWSLIMAPLKPSWTMTLSSSAMAAGTSCIGRVANPANRSGQDLAI